MQRRLFQGWIEQEFPGWSSSAVRFIGHHHVVAMAFAAMLVWLVFGVVYDFPAEWLLLTNLVCTMVILLMLLLVQHSQNRDMRAMQIKLDALITSSEAGNHWIAAEQLDAETIDNMRMVHHVLSTDSDQDSATGRRGT
jgi:low affinity Fe/Cu permease